MAEPIYLESGTKWSFASAVEWPGWCQHAKGEADPVGELVACRERYGDALALSGVAFNPPSDLEVAERLRGNKGTERAVEAFMDRATGHPLRDPGHTRELWPPRFYIGYVAWHTLIHACGIKDRRLDEPAT